MNIKLIYGSDTGNTEIIQQDVVDLLDEHDVSVVDLADIEPSDWEDYFPTFQELDFTGKTFAIFGLGDQIGYAEWFCDGVGILAEVILKNGGKVVGYTDKDKIYDFEKSLALKDENTFYGLCLDEDNQPHETIERLTNWVSKIKNEF